MAIQTMFSHTKEIIALTVPFLMVLVVVSLMTAGVIDNQTVTNTALTENQSYSVIILEPSITPSSFANILETQKKDSVVVPTEILVQNPITPTPTSTGILLPEAAATVSADIIEKE
jgi:hypothetical protein